MPESRSGRRESAPIFFAASLGPDEAMADSALIGIVMAGLLGGVAVGTGAGFYPAFTPIGWGG